MHCTVKKTQLIVDGGNDYLVTVKENRDCWHSLKL